MMSPYDLRFDSDAPSIGEGHLKAVKAQGREGISTLFEYDVILECEGNSGLNDSQITELLSHRACLTFWTSSPAPATAAARHTDAGASFRVMGIVSEIELLASPEPELIQYRIELVPSLWKSSLSHRSVLRTEGQNLWEMVDELLTNTCGMTKEEDFSLAETGAPSGSTKSRALWLQYNEADFDFLSRHLEHWGAFYYFRDISGHTQACFGADNKCFYKASSDHLTFDPNASGLTGTDAIYSLSCTQRSVTQKVAAGSYDCASGFTLSGSHADHLPHGSATVADSPLSTGIHHYGTYAFSEDSEGKKIAQLRADAIASARLEYVGETNTFWIRPGCRFTLANHPIPELNQEFLVTEIDHVLEPGADMRFVKRFRAIRFSQAFRPALQTPRPTVHGFLPAMIVGEDGIPAPVDENGCYRVQIPSIMTKDEEHGASPSLPVRMMQASSGEEHGVHLPLHAGAEVLLAFLHGDPDQPVIAGAVPNQATRSPIVDTDKTKGRIRSRSGIVIEFEDHAE